MIHSSINVSVPVYENCNDNKAPVKWRDENSYATGACTKVRGTINFFYQVLRIVYNI